MKVRNKLSETRDKEDAKKLIENGKVTKDKFNPYTPRGAIGGKTGKTAVLPELK